LKKAKEQNRHKRGNISKTGQSNVTSLRKLVYGATDENLSMNDDDDDEAEIGGMFRIMSEGQAKKSSAASTMDQVNAPNMMCVGLTF